MTYKEYREYLLSDKWEELRDAALERAGFQCQLVAEHGGQLEVHHRTYDRLGHEDVADLTVLCHRCHRIISAIYPKLLSNSGKLVERRNVTFIASEKLKEKRVPKYEKTVRNILEYCGKPVTMHEVFLAFPNLNRGTLYNVFNDALHAGIIKKNLTTGSYWY